MRSISSSKSVLLAAVLLMVSTPILAEQVTATAPPATNSPDCVIGIGEAECTAEDFPVNWPFPNAFTYQLPEGAQLNFVTVSGTWGGGIVFGQRFDGSAPAAVFVEAFQVATCFVEDVCWDNTPGTTVDWSVTLDSQQEDDLSGFADGAANMVVRQDDVFAINLTNLRILVDFDLVVPEVTGLTQSEAENSITAAGFSVGQITEEFSDTAPRGVVIRQAPEPGTTGQPEDPVDLVVSLGQQLTVSLSADPNDVDFNGTSILFWDSTGAETCSASGGFGFEGDVETSTPGDGFDVGPLPADTTFTITCTNGVETATDSVTVRVEGEAAVDLGADPQEVTLGGVTTLSWLSVNVNSCTASGGLGFEGDVPVEGSIDGVGPINDNTTFTLTCTNGVETATDSVTVQVSPPSVSLSADPSNVEFNGFSRLFWSSESAKACTAAGGFGFEGDVPTSSPEGGLEVGPLPADTTFTLDCDGAVDSITVRVDGQATVALTANPEEVSLNGDVELSWTSNNVNSCTASGGFGFEGDVPVEDAITGVGPLTENTTFTITCTNGVETANDSVTVRVTGTIVPDVTEMPKDEAEATLAESGFEVISRQEQSTEVAAGLVTRTDPPSGTSLATGSNVRMFVSTGDGGAGKPVARAEDKAFVVAAGESEAEVTLDGSLSKPGSEPDSTIVLYEWTDLSSSEIVDSSESATTKLSLPPGEYKYRLRVVNNLGLQSRTSTEVSVRESIDSIPGSDLLTDNQEETAEALVDVCNLLNSTPDEELTAKERDLQTQCTAIIQTDSTSAQVGALDAINGQQVTGFATNSVEISNAQIKNIAARVDALKMGARGISVAGLGLKFQGKQIPDAVVQSVLGKIIGGVAGDDGENFGRLGIFINGNITVGEKDETDRESGFDLTTAGLTVGADYRFTDDFVAGLALGYGEGDIDFDNNAGKLDTDGWSGVLFGTYYRQRFYVDGQFSYGLVNHDSERKIRYQTGSAGVIETIDRKAEGDTDGDQWSTGIEVGMNLDKGPWSIVPNMSLYYSKVDIDGFKENGAGGLNLNYQDQDAESLTLTLGGMFAYTWTPKWGVLRPHARVDYVTEFEDDSSIVNVRFQSDPSNTNPISIRTDDPDAAYFMLGLGVSAQFPHGISGFVDWQTLESYDDLWIHNYSFGVRFETSF